MLKYSVVLLVILCDYFSSVAQTHILYAEDTAYTQTFFKREASADSFNYYFNFPLEDLKNGLSDGEWILYNIPKKDSNTKDVNSYIQIEGHYKNALRDGEFDYNYVNKSSKSGMIHAREYRYNYKKGKLDGYFIGWYNTMDGNLQKMEEGFYSEGKKNGFFIHYDKDGRIDKTNLFRNDTLNEWAEYYNGELLHTGIGKLGCGQWSAWDKENNISYWGNFHNDSLVGYKKFNNGQLIKSALGNFPDYHSKYKYQFINDSIPTNGVLKYYNPNGDLLKTEHYQNSHITE